MIIGFIKGFLFGVMTLIAFMCIVVIMVYLCGGWNYLFNSTNQRVIALVCACGFLGGYIKVLEELL